MEYFLKYIIILISLFVFEMIYFKIANKYNIVDKPNERSSHSIATLRGGGIIFYFGIVLYFVYSNFEYTWFFLSLTLMTLISFLDDILTLSSKIRLIIHFSAVLLMAFQIGLFALPWYFLVLSFIFAVGVINAYNFMDGINGITASTSIAILLLLLIVNFKIDFVDVDFLLFTVISVFVFAFFNFRAHARTFAGDVGSVSIACIILFSLGLLIFTTGNFIYILFLSVYGIDTVWTILRRLKLKENIFEAHRSHLYQYLANEAKINKLLVAFIYGVLQFLTGLFVIWLTDYDFCLQFIYAVTYLIILSVAYLALKHRVITKYVATNNTLS